jgi:hypothetical protein
VTYRASRGLWGRLLSWTPLPLYKCRSCRRRFSRLEAGTAAPVSPDLASAFLRPTDNRSFHDVIQDLARDEQQQAERAATAGAVTNAPTRERP